MRRRYSRAVCRTNQLPRQTNSKTRGACTNQSAALSGSCVQRRLMSNPELRSARMFSRSKNQLDVSTEPQEHSQKPLDREPFDLARKKQRHLRWRIADDPCRLGLIQVMVPDDRRDLCCQFCLRNERFLTTETARSLGRPRFARRGHGAAWRTPLRRLLLDPRTLSSLCCRHEEPWSEALTLRVPWLTRCFGLDIRVLRQTLMNS